MDVVQVHTRAVELFLDRVRTVPDGAWGRATPCADWDVRTLVNHVVGEERWVVPLLEGKTIEQVGTALDGDLLGGLPGQAAEEAGKAAVVAFAEPGAVDRIVHLSFGDTPAEEYAMQLVADHVVHGWDLAVATGGEARLDPELVDVVATWFAAREGLYRGAGAIAERVEVGADASAQERLLAAFGRDAHWAAP